MNINISKIYNYKLYVFDLDGTIIDSEYSHYLAYNFQLKQKISFIDYENILFWVIKKNVFITQNNICKIKKENDFIDFYDKNQNDYLCNEINNLYFNVIIIDNPLDNIFIYNKIENFINQ